MPRKLQCSIVHHKNSPVVRRICVTGILFGVDFTFEAAEKVRYVVPSYRRRIPQVTVFCFRHFQVLDGSVLENNP